MIVSRFPILRSFAINKTQSSGNSAFLLDLSRQYDNDLLVVGAPDELELHDAISSLEENLGRPINYTLITLEEFRTRVKQHDPFLDRILAGDLIPVIGDPHAV